MRWTTWIGFAVGLMGLSGCYYGYQAMYFGDAFSSSSRPHPSYFCYDCHGYRFFDPYYDWCANYGFQFRWAAHPQVVHLYRERYVRIREQHPEYGRYRYQPRYRSSTRFREERDYDTWRSGRSGAEERPPDMERKSRGSTPEEKEHRKGTRERKDRGESKRTRPRRGGQGI